MATYTEYSKQIISKGTALAKNKAFDFYANFRKNFTDEGPTFKRRLSAVYNGVGTGLLTAAGVNVVPIILGQNLPLPQPISSSMAFSAGFLIAKYGVRTAQKDGDRLKVRGTVSAAFISAAVCYGIFSPGITAATKNWTEPEDMIFYTDTLASWTIEGVCEYAKKNTDTFPHINAACLE